MCLASNCNGLLRTGVESKENEYISIVLFLWVIMPYEYVYTYSMLC